MKYLVTLLIAFAASAANATYCSLDSPQFCPVPASAGTTAPSTSSATAAPSTSSASTGPTTSGAAAGAVSTSGPSNAVTGPVTNGATAGLSNNVDGSLSIGLPPGVRAAALPAIRCRSTSQAWGAGWNFVSRSTSDSDVDGVCQAADLAAMLIAQCQYRTGLEVLHVALGKAYPGVTWQIPAGTVNEPCIKPAPAPVVRPDPVPEKQVPVKPVAEKITLKAGALFDTDSADLKPEGMIELARLAQRLEPQRIHVVGHTDNTASAAYNEGLSLRRANAVRAYLILRGIDESMITAEGRGLREPIADNRSASGRMMNRRVVIEASGVAR